MFFKIDLDRLHYVLNLIMKNTQTDCRIKEANILAKQHGLVDVYFNLLKDITSKDECLMIAK